MANVNKVILVGNCGRDPEIRYLPSGRAVANMPVSVHGQKPTISISDDMPESGGGGAATGVTDGPDVAASDDDEGGEGDGDPDRRRRKELRTSKPEVGANERMPITNIRRDGAVNNMTKHAQRDKADVSATPSFDDLPNSAYIREAQLVRSPKRPGVPVPLPFSAPTLWRKVKDGSFPAPVKMSARVTAWSVGSVRNWLNAQAAA